MTVAYSPSRGLTATRIAGKLGYTPTNQMPAPDWYDFVRGAANSGSQWNSTIKSIRTLRTTSNTLLPYLSA